MLRYIGRLTISNTRTVQEFVCARNVRIILGKASLPWSAFFKGVTHVGDGDLPSSEPFKGLVLRYRLCAHRLATEEDPSVDLPTLELVLEDMRFLEATDPRDKIFSLSWILEDLKVTTPEVDYTKSTQQVYMEAARACILQSNSIAILYQAGGVSSFAGLPSWVPDWGSNEYRWPLVGKSGKQARSFGEFGQLGASGNSKSEFKLLKDEQLRIRGKFLDSIVGVSVNIVQNKSPASPADGDTCTDFIRTFRALHAFVKDQLSGTETQFYEDISEAFYTTLNQGNSLRFKPDEFKSWLSIISENPIDINMSTKTYSDILNVGPESITWYFECKRWLRDYYPPEGYEDLEAAPLTREAEFKIFIKIIRMGHQRLHKTLCERLKRRVLFTTERGMVGITAPWIRDGDVIALIAGMEFPVALRSVEGGWKYIGPIYLAGTMNGEFWSDGKGCEDICLV